MDIKKILVLGDSLSKGIVYNEQKRRYCPLENGFINTLAKKIRFTVTNVSRFGSTLTQALKIAPAKVEKENPDLVLIEFGGNDCDFNWDEIAQNPQKDHRPRTELNTFEENLTHFVKELNLRGKTPVLLNLPPLDAPRYFQWFTGGDESKGKEILKWLGDVCKIYWWHERYSCAVERVAQATKTRLIDIRGAFLKKEDYREFLCVDGIHPNEKGHKLIEDTILGYIQSHASYLLA